MGISVRASNLSEGTFQPGQAGNLRGGLTVVRKTRY
jgi:hypothetical protein